MLDFKTFLVSDANAALTDEEHMATLLNFIQNPFGDVRSTDEMIGMLTALRHRCVPTPHAQLAGPEQESFQGGAESERQ